MDKGKVNEFLSSSNSNLDHWRSLFLENRNRLLASVKDITKDMIDFTPDPNKFESIGSLLFHIAAVEWSWIFEDIDGEEMDFEEWKYGFVLRDFVNLPQLTGKSLDYYLDKLLSTRKLVEARMDKFQDKQLKDLTVSSDDENIKFSIEWIFNHLLNHEAEHMGQIKFLKRLYNLKTSESAK